jgi:membrane protease subunit (stomatin/prohibitin family)
MGLFGWGKKEGGLMDQIRCDQKDYLIWKWRPQGHDANSTKRENAIRWGSSLRVEPSQVAAFVYSKDGGSTVEYIDGGDSGKDTILNTANLPILSSIIGLAYDGGTPFQAEVYFFNLQGLLRLPFRLQYFDVFDTRNPQNQDFSVPVSVEGSLSFGLGRNIEAVKKFVSLNGLNDFNVADFEEQVHDGIVRFVKGIVSNVPSQLQMSVLQLERRIIDISNYVETEITKDVEADFGVEVKRFDISAIEVDKTSEGYQQLARISSLQMQATEKTILAQTQVNLDTLHAQSEVNIENLRDTQRIGSENMEEQLRMQREAYERNQKLQTETTFFETHKLNIQTEAQRDVLKSAAENLGQMGTADLSGGGAGFNPAGLMTGMAMGGAMGSQMANMMNQMGNTMAGGPGHQTPPPPPQIAYMVVFNGQQAGPFNLAQLGQLVANGQMLKSTYVWKQGMSEWAEAGVMLELSALFNSNPAVPPPIPPPIPPPPPMRK